MPSVGGLLGARWSYHGPPESFRLSMNRSRPKQVMFGASCGAKQGCRMGAVSKQFEMGRMTIDLEQPVIDVGWHANGDYLLTLTKPVLSAQLKSKNVHRLMLHRVSKLLSQSPFTQESLAFTSEEWRHASFHEEGKPLLFVASSSNCRVFDLLALKELRNMRLEGTCREKLSAMGLHHSGNHLVLGTFEGQFNWFDQELGNLAFKKLKLNHGAVRQIHWHKKRPLISCANDDGTLLILHATLPVNELDKATIIPVQLIRTTNVANPLSLSDDQQETEISQEKRKHMTSAFSTVFHNFLPNVYAGLADGTIRQFVPWH
ncbi:Ribosome biogenesis protein 1 [Cichlidogyrus casuarinus]|uniref:Ribosome biogenesis protein 1 n=1 Tax=Cichlidogyrus casuarinus TaxID=1844966 RepID=A0ABD2PRE6_9PLAT